MAISDILDIDTLSNALGSVFLLPRICTLLRFSKSEVVQEGFEKVTFFLWLFCFYLFEYYNVFYNNLPILSACVSSYYVKFEYCELE